MRVLLRTGAVLLALASGVFAQPAPPADEAPLLRVNSQGPLGVVEALAFSRDGRTLYAGGWDQVIHAWSRGPDGTFAYDPEKVLRVPAGADLGGAIRTLDVSHDGRWLAAAGRGFVSEGNKRTGWVWPTSSLDERAKLDKGTIYVFDLAGGRPPTMLRGHRDQIARVAFAAPGGGGPTTLASFGEDASVRVWDVEQGTEISSLTDVPRWDARAREWKWEKLPKRDPKAPFPSKLVKPDVVAWRTGRQPHDVKVAFLARDVFEPRRDGTDARIYVWQPDPEVVDVDHEAVPPNSLRMIAGPGGNGSLLFSTIQDVRRISADRLQGAGGARSQRLGNPNNREEVFDLALAGDDLASLVLEQPDENADTYLLSVRLHRLGGGQRAQSAEWRDDAPRPMATTPDGTRIAVVDGRAGAVRLYEVAGLVGGDGQPKQTLRTNGEEFRRVSFAQAKNDQRLGLLLARDARGETWDLAVDLRDRKVSTDVDAWTAEAPEAGDWNVDWDQNQWGVRIRRNGGTVRIPFPRDTAPDPRKAYTTCPAGEHCRVPLIALNLLEDGSEPTFLLCDLERGRQLRWYTGHTGPISDFAFSADGRFLASVGTDRTVRVWPVEDVDEATLEKRGEVHGLELVERVENGRKQLVVLETPDAGKLKRDAVVQGLVEDDAEGNSVHVPYDRVWDLYHHVTRIAPGETVTLRTTGGDATLPVGQATDVRWPLFSLFVDGEGNRLSWIAWDPLGKYDYDDPRMQRRIGWHFNTGDPRQPVLFATGEQYREQNHERRMMWNRLNDEAAPPPPPPKFSLRFFSRGYEDHPLEVDRREGVVSVARGPNVYGLVSIEEAAVGRVEAVELGIPAGEGVSWVPMERRDGTDAKWVADVAWPGEASWERRETPYAFKARVRVRGRREWTEETHPVVYAPQAPQLQAKAAPTVDDDGNLVFAVQVTPLSGAFDLEVAHTVDGKPVPLADSEAVAKAVRDGEPVKIPARAGVNGVRVAAWNRGSQAFRWKDWERSTLELPSVNHDPGPSPAVVDAVGTGDGAGPVAKNAYRVTESSTIVHGVTTDKSTAPVLKRVDPEGESIEAKVDPETGRFRARVTGLKPGDNGFALTATRNGVTHETPFTIRHVPVPTVVVQAPDGRTQFTQVDDGTTVKVLVTVDESAGGKATAIEVTRGEQTIPAEAVTRVAEGFAAEIPLQRGTNVVAAKVVEVAFGDDESETLGADEGLSENTLSLAFLRPPVVDRKSISYPKRPEQSGIDVAFEVESFEKPAIDVRLNRTPVELQDVAVERDADEGDRWKVTLKDLALETARALDEQWTTNDVAIVVRNEDGRDAVDLDPIRYVGAPPPTVDLSFGEGRVDQVVSGCAFELPLHVRTNVPLSSLEVVSLDDAFEAVPVELAKPIPAGFRGQKVVQLDPGLGAHRLRIRARTPDRELFTSEDALRLNVVASPARIVVEEIVVRPPGEDPQTLRNETREGVQLRDEAGRTAAEYGRILVRGRVLHFGGLCEELRRRTVVTGAANGFAYDKRLVDETGAFELDLLLKGRTNRVRLSSPTGPVADSGALEFEVECVKPLDKQNLHLVAISTEATERDVLVENVGEHLNLDRKDDAAEWFEGWSSPTFQGVTWWEAFTKHRACKDKIEPFIIRLTDELGRIHRGDAEQVRTDVVLLYYEGRDAVVREHDGRQDFALRCRDEALVTGEFLRASLGSVQGVHLIFLDTTLEEAQQDSEEVVRNTEADNLGIIRVTSLAESDRDHYVLPGIKAAINGGRGRVGELPEVIRNVTSPRTVDSFVEKVGDVVLGAAGSE